MIFEALSALTDPSGSDVTTIFNFIEVRHILVNYSLLILVVAYHYDNL